MSLGKAVRALALCGVMAAGLSGGAALALPPAGGGPGSGPNQRTEAQRIVLRAVNQMNEARERSCADIHQNTRATVRSIVRLARDGADDVAIVAAGDTGKARNTSRATTGTDRISQVRTNALAALADAEGAQEQIDRINAAATAATTRVNTCRDQANARIDAAVTRAITDDSGGGG